MKRSKLREAALVGPVIKYLRDRGFLHVKREMQFFEHRIDVYAYSPTDNRAVAVELKLFKWRRAFQQASMYQLCADVAFVAVPSKTGGRVDLALLQAHGVGLITIGDSGICTEVLPPARSGVMREHYKDAFAHAAKRRT